MKKKIIGITFIVLLFGFFLIINLFNNKEKNNNTPANDETTKNNNEINTDIIYIEGLEEIIYTKKYISHLGYNFKYEDKIFNLSQLSDGAILIQHKNNKNNYLKIEKLDEKEFNKQYDNLNSNVDKSNGIYVIYKFLRGGNLIYLKITQSIVSNFPSIEGIDVRLDYIINSISFN